MKVGVFGGSFNPVHSGHLKLASHARETLNLDKVFFVPSYQTPLKDEPLMPAGRRIKLLRDAIKGRPGFSVSLCEIKRRGLSYTVDTLKSLKKSLPKNAVLYFLAGMDNVKNFKRWKSPEEILRLSRLVIFSRPGFPKRKIPAGALFVSFDALELSSTEIRKRLKIGESHSHR
ncbi:MAG: nicotinate (nicotinamide) nucleotide adenylyltransferase [Candidatus Omnitrophica bacterium]|nr:nicotinate (nicotinamide) nucleotide adenylyltransferase [Candidatus Omnitrophota bacterium]